LGLDTLTEGGNFVSMASSPEKEEYPTLFALKNGKHSMVIPLNTKEMVIGRSEECDIIIHNPGVSRTQCALTVVPSTVPSKAFVPYSVILKNKGRRRIKVSGTSIIPGSTVRFVQQWLSPLIRISLHHII